MMGFFETLRDLCFPPSCAACGMRLPPSVGDLRAPLLCADCAKSFEECLHEQCPHCFAPYWQCRCQPSVMERAGSRCLIKLSAYGGASSNRAVDRVILGMKQHCRIRNAACCARELAPLLKAELDKQEPKEGISHTVITHLPRSRYKVMRYGFDQSAELARALSACTGYAYQPLLRRCKNRGEQKGLTARERRANLKGAFGLHTEVKGARVILIDDVVTTGSGMAECVRVLRKGGAAQIVSVAVAVTPKKRGKGG